MRTPGLCVFYFDMLCKFAIHSECILFLLNLQKLLLFWHDNEALFLLKCYATAAVK
jgi:hypothetical protein